MSAPKSKQKKNFRPLPQKGKAFRQQNSLLAVLQWGVNHTVQELDCVPEKPLLLKQDFEAHGKIQISNHFYNDHELPSKFKFKEYCPLVFRDLRIRFQEESEDLLASLCDGPLVGRESSGRSGAQFYVTHDERIVVKTLNKEEVSHFHHTFEAYHSHIVETSGATLLPRYLAMYRITVQEKEHYMIVMNNVMSCQIGQPLRIYDLKVVIYVHLRAQGSTVDRSASDKERLKDLPTLKDNDFTAASEQLVAGANRALFCSKLVDDTRLLEKLNLMDYSLLVAVYDAKDIPEDFDASFDPYFLTAPNAGDHVYCVGIIDALTVYTTKKKAAHAAKAARLGKVEFSTVSPDQYARRFLEFITSVVV